MAEQKLDIITPTLSKLSSLKRVVSSTNSMDGLEGEDALMVAVNELIREGDESMLSSPTVRPQDDMVLFKEQSFMSNRSRSENFLAPMVELQQKFKSSPELGTPRKGINDESWLNITPAPPRETIESSESPIIEEPLRVFLVAAET